MYGIENLKKIVKFACDFTKQVATSTSDGWQWTDIFSFIDEMAELPGAVKSWAAIKQEVAELSIDERQELYQYLADEFDIADDRIEGLIEHSLMWVISTIGLVEEFKPAPKV